MTSLKGTLLISSGALFDPNFTRTVVLIGEHTADGALGVVLNRPLGATVEDTVPALASLVEADAVVFGGGPVQPASPVLLAEFTSPVLADLPVFGSVGFLIGHVPEDAMNDVVRARVYAGHAGWGPGQLERELAEDSWILDPAREDDVFTREPATLWRRVLARKGPGFGHVDLIPHDPRTN